MNSFVIVAACFLATAFAAVDRVDLPCPPLCQYIPECSQAISPVYGNDGGKCRVYLNQCYRTRDNCERAARCQRALPVIDEEECDDICNFTCPAAGSLLTTVCGTFHYYNNKGVPSFERITRANLCELNKYACQTNRGYSTVAEGPCPLVAGPVLEP